MWQLHDVQDWIAKDRMACGIIHNCCEVSQWPHIQHCTTSKDIWDVLQKFHHDNQIDIDIHYYFGKLFTHKYMEGAPMADHIAAMHDLQHRINSMGETIQGWLQAVGIRTRMRSMERGAFMTSWREKKLHGVVLTISGVSGNAATRLESFVTKNGAFAYGSLPEVDDLFRRQAVELDRKKREALLHQLQQILQQQVIQAPVYHLGFPIGVGPRVDDIMATAIPGFYMSPYEDLKLRRP